MSKKLSHKVFDKNIRLFSKYKPDFLIKDSNGKLVSTTDIFLTIELLTDPISFLNGET